MGLLAAWVLLAALRAGSAQLTFSAVDFIERYTCDTTVILPCRVTNLKENNDSNMFVSWKKQGEVFFSFNGAEQRIYRHEKFQSANLLSQQDLSKGIASLKLKSAEADDGNYSCEVTELNREGETKVDLRTHSGRHFDLMESIVIAVLLFLIIIFCWAQLGVIAFKYETASKKKKYVAIVCSIFTTLAVIAVVLFVQDGDINRNRIGLAFLVPPAAILMVFQYFVFKMVLDDLTHKGYVLIAFQVSGYIVALVGFALSVSACPPVLLSVVIAGLVIMAVADLFALAYMYTSCSRMKDHQTPRR